MTLLRSKVYVPIDAEDRAKLEVHANKQGIPIKQALEELLDQFPVSDPPIFHVPPQGSSHCFDGVDISIELNRYAVRLTSSVDPPTSTGLLFQGAVSCLLSDKWREMNQAEA